MVILIHRIKKFPLIANVLATFQFLALWLLPAFGLISSWAIGH
jgi:hypothetical protein